MTEKAWELVSLACDYAMMAEEQLTTDKCEPPEGSLNPDEETIFKNKKSVQSKFATHFLFPNLDDDERELFSMMLRMSEILTNNVNVDRSNLKAEDVRIIEPMIREQEAHYVKIKQTITDLNIEAKLTDPQKEILQWTYMKVIFG